MVVGLGLIGLVAAQLLRANGCKVIGVDFDQQKVDMAASKGIVAVNPGRGTDPVRFVEDYTGGIGADGVLITASTQNHEVIHQASEMSRKRGRIVLVGVVGLNMRRDDFYKKELSFLARMGPDVMTRNMRTRGTIIRWLMSAGRKSVILRRYSTRSLPDRWMSSR